MLRSTFVAALGGGDASGAAAVFADDGRILLGAADFTVGREAIEAFWQAGLDAGLTSVELEVGMLEAHGEVAYETGRYALHLQPAEGGGTVGERGSYVLVHRRQSDGSWRWAVELFAPDPPVSSRRRRA